MLMLLGISADAGEPIVVLGDFFRPGMDDFLRHREGSAEGVKVFDGLINGPSVEISLARYSCVPPSSPLGAFSSINTLAPAS